MKLIKCGNSQTRIAQACDRCRSKKIRCDGIRPCCTQCANVGFECKTSDKLSRRAFPRGYTESLEERVRALEAEVRDLKDLLDAKDEQLDMLSRIHSFSPYTPPASTSSGVSRRQQPFGSESPKTEQDATFTMVDRSSLMGSGDRNGFVMGASSGRPFLEIFKNKLQNGRRFEQPINTDVFLTSPPSVESLSSLSLREDELAVKAPPRVRSDHLLVTYFQEYHPLFPIIHRPTFLRSYEALIKSVESGKSGAGLPKYSIAQLFLVFAISSQQTDARDTAQQQSYDAQWQAALGSIIMDSTLETLQCLVLAQLYCFAKGDYSRLSQYKSLAMGICTRLGLHQSQKKFTLSALECEMRKRVFWCASTLDCFSAAMTGLPRCLNESLIETEYPADVDDEYVSDKGFLPTIPGDSTKISSALALFRVGVVLGRIVEGIYAPGMQTISQKVLRDLEDELDMWKTTLAPHLRLEFTNGMPSTNVVHSRSPLLILAYHYCRILIHRPVIGSGLSSESGSLHSISESSKCIVQIIQLLTERKLGFSFCLNRNQLLAICGITLLYSALDYQQNGVLRKDSQKLLCAVVEELEKDHCFATKQFRLIAAKVMPINSSPVLGRRESVSSGGPLDFSASPSSTSSHDDILSVHGGSPTFRHLPANISPRQQKTVRKMSSATDLTPQQARNLAKYSNRLTSASLTDLPPTANHQYGIKMQNSSPMVGNVDLFDNSWPMDNSQPPEEWAQLVTMLDSTGAAHIYGEYVPGGGLVQVPQQEWQSSNGMMGSNNMTNSFFQDFEDGVPSVGSLSDSHSEGEQHFPDENEILWATSAA